MYNPIHNKLQLIIGHNCSFHMSFTCFLPPVDWGLLVIFLGSFSFSFRHRIATGWDLSHGWPDDRQTQALQLEDMSTYHVKFLYDIFLFSWEVLNFITPKSDTVSFWDGFFRLIEVFVWGLDEGNCIGGEQKHTMEHHKRCSIFFPSSYTSI